MFWKSINVESGANSFAHKQSVSYTTKFKKFKSSHNKKVGFVGRRGFFHSEDF